VISILCTHCSQTKLKLTWIAESSDIKLNLFEFGTIVTKDLSKDEDFKEFVNPDSKAVVCSNFMVCSLCSDQCSWRG
jgi:hypothetical protein